jgi:hypothetical protein
LAKNAASCHLIRCFGKQCGVLSFDQLVWIWRKAKMGRMSKLRLEGSRNSSWSGVSQMMGSS